MGNTPQLSKHQIEEIRQGKIAAFEDLFNLFYSRVKNFAQGMIKNEDTAEEIAQNVFMKVWMNREKLSADLSFSSYIFTITQNEVHDYFRSKYYFLHYQESLQKVDSKLEYEIDSEYNIKEIKELVNTTLLSMPEQRKLVFKLSREKFLTNDEIAQKLNISKRTVEKHISLALATIKKNLSDFLFWIFIFFIQ
ncbi:RNA polymerase sigma-70 factor [Paludibacter sp. 221]|uniref:RNA polymerase sigma-70 factor n=1 Tax=Paludibacter sp. 221 TaxID=2302939 RepID=UPI0013D054C7|nr:RNA polymerase sigma-70 factor [Paludibacter sp. 221]NDV46584.1 RNA polymerase sigma-70 factor [Paludibacter sp. 221]